MPLLGGVNVDEQRAGECGENEEMRLEAEVPTLAEESDNGESERENSPGDGDPGQMAFAVGEDDDQNGGGGCVELRGFDGGAGGLETEPARAEIEKGNDKREGDET